MGKTNPYLTVRVPAIALTCPITTMLFVDHVLSRFMAPRTLTILWNTRYMRRFLSAFVRHISGTLQSLRATSLKIARWRRPIRSIPDLL